MKMNIKSNSLGAGCPNLTPRRIAALAKEFGSPFYVYDFDGLETRARWLRSALPGDSSCFTRSRRILHWRS